MGKFLLTGCLYSNNLQSFHRLSKKAKNYQNLTTENGSKQRFSLLQEIVVIQTVYCLRTQAVSIKKPGFRPNVRVAGI